MKTFVSLVTLTAIAALATTLPAQAAPLCDSLGQAMVATKADDAHAETVTKLLAGFGPAPAACSFSLDLSGSKSANCNWAFPYRTVRAQSEFNTMLAALTACADPAFAIETDQPVNHPDFYDLRLLRIADGEVGLSIKDKVGLNQTYLFLRLTPAL